MRDGDIIHIKEHSTRDCLLRVRYSCLKSKRSPSRGAQSSSRAESFSEPFDLAANHNDIEPGETRGLIGPRPVALCSPDGHV